LVEKLVEKHDSGSQFWFFFVKERSGATAPKIWKIPGARGSAGQRAQLGQREDKGDSSFRKRSKRGLKKVLSLDEKEDQRSSMSALSGCRIQEGSHLLFVLFPKEHSGAGGAGPKQRVHPGARGRRAGHSDRNGEKETGKGILLLEKEAKPYRNERIHGRRKQQKRRG